ncbi:SRPBCC family protein [Ruania zhangjianzhongii]|uniref:SRPBCC family protein n=1 Tax=Ruania zhangjianzhongii TaxID=2603206 RepID=UPI0011C9A8E8|nr:SRPBCC family protein [Ruania zhangjianzhongii]
MSLSHDSWTIERDYPHPPDRVFAAWADPSTKVRWFDLSGTADPDYHSDFRVGGTESFRTPVGSRPDFTYTAQYRDIVPDERIVTTYEMAMDGQRTSVSVATLELSSTAAGTHLVYTEQGVYLDGLDNAQDRSLGTASQLDRLGAVLDGQS